MRLGSDSGAQNRLGLLRQPDRSTPCRCAASDTLQVALGIPRTIARDVYRRHRSWWNMSAVRGVTRGLRNSYFAQRGLYELVASWEVNHRLIWNIGPEQQGLPLG